MAHLSRFCAPPSLALRNVLRRRTRWPTQASYILDVSRLCTSSKEGGETYTFIARVRQGLETLLHEELSVLPTCPKTQTTLGFSVGLETVSGAVELSGPWQILYPVALRSRLTESVWVRVGAIFQFADEESFAKQVQSLPWNVFFGLDVLATIPLSVSVRNSFLERDALGRTLDDALRSLANGTGPRSKWSPFALGLRAVVVEDQCSIELNCSGRLGVRKYIYGGSSSSSVGHASPIPTPYRGELIASNKILNQDAKGVPSWSLRPDREFVNLAGPKTPSIEAAVAQEWHGTRDLHATHAAALVNKVSFAAFPNSSADSNFVVWDPFCASGTVLLELLGKSLGLPASRDVNGFPSNGLRPFNLQQNTPEPASPNEPFQGLKRVTFVGSDLSSTAVLRARRHLHRFYEHFKDQIQEVSGHLDKCVVEKPKRALRKVAKLCPGPLLLDSDEQEIPTPIEKSNRSASTSDAAPSSPPTPSLSKETLRSFSSLSDKEWGIDLPCDVSLNVSRFERIAPFVSGPLIVTRVPCEIHALGPTARSAQLYRQFGHFLASRSDLVGAYVITESRVFRRQSRLDWEVLHSFRDHAGLRWQILRWDHSRPHGHGPGYDAPTKAVTEDPDFSARSYNNRWQRPPRNIAMGRPRRIARPIRDGAWGTTPTT